MKRAMKPKMGRSILFDVTLSHGHVAIPTPKRPVRRARLHRPHRRMSAEDLAVPAGNTPSLFGHLNSKHYLSLLSSQI